MSRYSSFVMRFFVNRAIPHGIIDWRYLLIRPPQRIALHRRLWLSAKPSAMPLTLFVAIELVLWLKWASYGAFRSCFRLTRNIPEPGLFKRLLVPSLAHALPPSDILAFGLHEKENSERLWDYVYTHEASAYHRYRQTFPGYTENIGILQDKRAVTETLAGLGIPAVPELEIMSQDRQADVSGLARHEGRLFLKTRFGSCSRDAFVLETEKRKTTFFSVKSGMAAEPATEGDFREAMSRNDYIVQRFTPNHPVLERLCDTGDAVTLRVITENRGRNRIRISSAVLEIPNASGRLKFTHTLLPLDLDSGKILPFPKKNLPDDARNRLESVYTRALGHAVPHWEMIRQSAVRAHLAYPGLYAVAWDFVVTPCGPLILEGNTGWDTRFPQMIHGGLLAGLFQGKEG